MKEIGQILALEAVRSMPQGMYLTTDEDNEILLPNKYIPAGFEEGDKIEVFIYTDSEDRVIATTLDPKIKLHEVAFLKAIDVNQYGAFFNWGMEKDLLVPFSEQYTKVVKGKRYLVYLYKDEVTDRLVGTTKFGRFFKANKVKIKSGDEVNLIVSGETEIGFKVIVNNSHYGMLYKNELFKSISVGERLKGYLQRVRKDNKLNVTLNSSRLNDVESLANTIYERLLNENGVITVSDKSGAEEIYKEFQVSKKAFRRALGLLYSKKKVTINPTSVHLIKSEL